MATSISAYHVPTSIVGGAIGNRHVVCGARSVCIDGATRPENVKTAVSTMVSSMIRSSDLYLRLHLGDAACVLGNGQSRLEFDLETIQQECWLIGCNVIVTRPRDHGGYPWCDYVCGQAADVFREFVRSQIRGPVYVSGGAKSEIALIDDLDPVHFEPFGRKGALTGILAILWAMWLGCDPIVLVGFDADGSNVFRGTPGYEKPQEEYRGLQADRLRGVTKALCTDYHFPTPAFYQIGQATTGIAKAAKAPDRWRLHAAT